MRTDNRSPLTSNVAKSAGDLRPRHAHDCESCVFVGAFGSADYWLHFNTETLEADDHELIIRKSAEESDYESFPLFVALLISDSVRWQTGAEFVRQYRASNHELLLLELWDELDYSTVVGLHDDLRVARNGEDYYIKDRHGNRLLRADWDAVNGHWLIREIPEEFRGELLVRTLHSGKAILMLSLLIRQMMTDSGI